MINWALIGRIMWDMLAMVGIFSVVAVGLVFFLHWHNHREVRLKK